MSRHRQSRTRPRYGRIAAAGTATLVTGIALAGGLGLVPGTDEVASASGDVAAAVNDGTGTDGVTDGGAAGAGAAAATGAVLHSTAEPTSPVPVMTAAEAERVLPAASGTGRRVVFSEEAQRVWLVGRRNQVVRTYLVSGSLTDNLHPGSYEVYSRSFQAWGIDDSGTMQWFVRFTHGENAAIGFHSIPVDDGERVQTEAQLGTPQSHGCIRQKDVDAKALWRFAPLGTPVVVVA